MKTKKVDAFSYARGTRFITMSVFINSEITNTNMAQNVGPSILLTCESGSS